MGKDELDKLVSSQPTDTALTKRIEITESIEIYTHAEQHCCLL